MKVFYRVKKTPDGNIIPFNYNIANALEEARNYCNKVDFELVIRVYVSTKSKFVGKNPNITYYCRADYKDYQVYTFKIVKCNALDNTKSQEIVYSSTEYTWEERKEMTERILDLIKVNNIKKCYI